MSSYPAPQRHLRGHHPGRPSDRAALTGEHHAYLAAHLTPRDRWLARVLAEHRVLTAAQITQLAFASTRGANRRLLSLYRLSHAVGVNGFFADLVAIARHSPNNHPGDVSGAGRAVTAWWSEARCARLFGEHVRPDAYGRWREPSDGQTSEVEFFLEYDTGTEALNRVAGKLTGYERLAAASGIPTPVLFWLPTPTREANARTALAAVLRGLDRPDLVPVATTSTIPAPPQGDRDDARYSWGGAAPDSPAGARWFPLTPSPPGRASAVARVRLAQLAQVWPHATPPTPTGAGPAPRPGTGLTPPAPMPPATPGWSTRTSTTGPGHRSAGR